MESKIEIEGLKYNCKLSDKEYHNGTAANITQVREVGGAELLAAIIADRSSPHWCNYAELQGEAFHRAALAAYLIMM